jgi:hypothetical protein
MAGAKIEAARPLGFLIAASIVAFARAVIFGSAVLLSFCNRRVSRIAVKAAVSAL